MSQIEDFSKYEKDEYLKFSIKEKNKEFLHSIFYHLLYSIPFIYYIYYFFQMGFIPFLTLFLLCLFFEGFFFIIGHLNAHESMLIYYQQQKIIVPYAYYHHYVHSLLFSEIPFGYRLSANHLFLLFNIASVVFNVNELVFGGIYLISAIDFLAHEYHHSFRKRHYISYNPFSSKFVGIYYLMSSLEKLKVLDVGTHSSIHHKEKSEQMDLTEDWLDLKIYPLNLFIDWVASTEWFVFKKLLQTFNETSEAKYTPNKNYKIFENFVDLWTIIKVFGTTFIISWINLDLPVIPNIRYFLIFICFLRYLF